MKKYMWKQLNQWDAPRAEYHTKRELVSSGLSQAICTYALVEQVGMGGGYIQTKPIKKTDVTIEMLEIAGSI